MSNLIVSNLHHFHITLFIFSDSLTGLVLDIFSITRLSPLNATYPRQNLTSNAVRVSNKVLCVPIKLVDIYIYLYDVTSNTQNYKIYIYIYITLFIT